MKRFYRVLLLLILLLLPLNADYPEILQLHSLQDPLFQQLQGDLERLSPLTLRWENRMGDPLLKEQILSQLNFYQYRVKEGENLYTIAADLMLNPDTLSSLNGIEHPLFLEPGTLLVVPNFPGIFLNDQDRNHLDSRIRETPREEYRSLSIKMRMENRLHSFRFFPAERFTREERLFFVSRPFRSPLIHFSMGSPFGFRPDPFTGIWTLHGGIDLNVPEGTAVFSIGDGIVKETGLLEKYGIYIIIEHEGGYESLYGHLSQILPAKGEKVQAGTLIAYSGNTGRSTGPHLHLEIRRNGVAVDPMDLISSP